MSKVYLINVHDPTRCAGRGCVIHHPSDHHMVTWPKVWRDDHVYFERICQHSVGHPDPDDVTYYLSIGRDGVGVHGCCGCCVPPTKEET